MNDLELNDIGNATLLVKRHGGRIRYAADLRRWFVWDGKRWTVDEAGHLMELAKATARSLLADAASIQEDHLRREVVRWANTSHNKTRLEAMIALASSDPAVAIKTHQFDADPMLLSVLNGTLDLRTGTLQAHAPQDLISKLAPVVFDPQAQAPIWGACLDRILGGNPNLIAFMRRLVGYTLTGSTAEQALFVLYGTGANGKTTFLEAIRGLLGELAMHTPTETLIQQKSRTAYNDLARLRGARFVTAVETGFGAKLAESLIKQLTGGDLLTARFLFGEFFEFRPAFKLFLATNHRPRIEGVDHGIWRRLILIPFAETIDAEERIPDLAQKLEAELSGILNWALQGCREWQECGLQVPPEVLAATAEYRQDSDPFEKFWQEKCLIKPGSQATSKVLFSAYQQWCAENDEEPKSQKWLAMRLKERGIPHGKTSEGAFWKDLALLNGK
jgi:putative DNA primase/helicase